jgi:NhaP-type Na+/H+ or K+/H+ antiporter
MTIAPIIIFVGALIFLAHLFAGIFSRTKIPDVLLLFLIGLFLGPLMGLVTPADFGVVGPVFTTITLVFILFQSGTELRIDNLRKALRGTLALTTFNFLATLLATGMVIWSLTDLGPILSFMLGAIIGGTSSATVVPLVNQLTMRSESKAILVLESAVSDAFTIVVPLALLEAYKLGQLHFNLIAGHLLASFLLAILFGAVGALVWSVLLNRVRTFQNAMFTTPAFVFVVFGITEFLGYSGPIAALTFGATMGNMELLRFPILKHYSMHEAIKFNEIEKVFFSEVVFLLKTFFFVYIGLSVQLTNMTQISFGLGLTVLIFLLRILVVRFSVHKSTPVSDASAMAVMVPKGLGAAVLASIPLQQGVVAGEFIQNVTFSVILFTTLFTTILIFLLDRTALSTIYARIFSGFGLPSSTGENVDRRSVLKT